MVLAVVDKRDPESLSHSFGCVFEFIAHLGEKLLDYRETGDPRETQLKLRLSEP